MLEIMGNKKLLEKTTNRGEFNRRYKKYLENVGKIRCTRCKYHTNENNKDKWYGGFEDLKFVKFPNWKLISKNRKQWMGKSIKIKTDYSKISRNIYYEIEF